VGGSDKCSSESQSQSQSHTSQYNRCRFSFAFSSLLFFSFSLLFIVPFLGINSILLAQVLALIVLCVAFFSVGTKPPANQSTNGEKNQMISSR
jgi:VIT1/CCC1 family predicted Fe2+/Mn2+ transporter